MKLDEFRKLRKGDVVRATVAIQRRFEWCDCICVLNAHSLFVIENDKPLPSVRRDNVWFHNGICVLKFPVAIEPPVVMSFCLLPEEIVIERSVETRRVYPWPLGKLPPNREGGDWLLNFAESTRRSDRIYKIWPYTLLDVSPETPVVIG